MTFRQRSVDRAAALGATPVDVGQGGADWMVMADLDRSEFCVYPA